MNDGTLWAVEVFTATVKERLERLELKAERYRTLALQAHDDTGECTRGDCRWCQRMAKADATCR